ncbi:MAG: UDP-N-acetylglucosamine 1-carboxyvinyltransferase 1 [Firmicutes bacterium ADurb.Bin182]|nr:MAG: UDP-N-acetylglucosamine 1-carboxyvinyltransferase 1 [Firmicutes bacterium ADurb.Bin182]
MSRLVVQGGKKLKGSIEVPGAKNAVLPILAASLLSTKPIRLEHCPHLLDVDNMLLILRYLGCSAEWDQDSLVINAASADKCVMPDHLAKELRSSIFMLGPVLGRFKKALFSYPGGCEIGHRPIDLHLHGLSALNVRIVEEHGHIICDGKELTGASIHLDYPSVGATENLMMAAVAAKGQSMIFNAAREPEIEDLQNFLNLMGCQVSGAGTSTIAINGGFEPCPVTYRIIPDRIVTGTLMCAAAITGGDIQLYNIRPAHLGSIVSKLREAGCAIDVYADSLRIRGPHRPRELKLVETLPHPGFPTDMQAQVFALCTIADGTSIIVENVFENRFKHASELARMGAVSMLKDRTAIIRGVPRLTGAQVTARDLRGGAALVLAGLCADGTTVVNSAEHIDRGYERLENMLNSLGAEVYREN